MPDPILQTFTDNWYSGAGQPFAGLRDSVTGLPKSMFPFGNCPRVEVAMTVERRKHKDSRGANRLEDKVQTVTKGGEFRCTLEDIARKNVGLYLSADQQTIAASSYSSGSPDICPDSALVVGSIWKLRKPNVSSLVIKDSAGTPATLTLGTHYRIVDAGHGLIEILSLGALTQPFKAEYSYAQTIVVPAFSADDNREYYIYVATLNTEPTTDQRIGFHCYRVVFDPASVIALVNAEQGSFELTATILRDPVLALDSQYGEFCRWDYVDANV